MKQIVYRSVMLGHQQPPGQYTELKSRGNYTTMFFKWRKNDWRCVSCASPLPACPFTQALQGFKFSNEYNNITAFDLHYS